MRYIKLFVASITLITATSFSANKGLLATSSSFTENGMIPSKYSCEGAGVNPPLHIANIPAGAKSLALIVDDPDAPLKGGFTHWVVWNIDLKGDIPENFKGANQGMNDAKKTGYIGMCPPNGTHHYHFKVYALDTRLNLNTSTDKTILEKAMDGHILSETDLVGLYKKAK
jgi:Raf kinase inhibitor-like YbhB/YbcL family protein